MTDVSNYEGSPAGVSRLKGTPPVPDREFQRLEQGYVQAKERLAALERKCASEIEKYGEEHFLNDPNWHREHYEASEAVRSAKYWLDAYISEMRSSADAS